MAVQARQRDDSGKPIQLVYVRTAMSSLCEPIYHH